MGVDKTSRLSRFLGSCRICGKLETSFVLKGPNLILYCYGTSDDNSYEEASIWLSLNGVVVTQHLVIQIGPQMGKNGGIPHKTF